MSDKSRAIIETPIERRRKELSRELASTTRTIEHATDGAVQVGFMNTDVPAEDGVTVLNMGIGGNFEHPVGTLEAMTYAANNQDRRVMVVNNAGSSASSLVPSEVMAEMKATGSFVPQGEWMLDTLRRELDNYGELSLVGNSAGARIAMGIAAAVSVVRLDNPLARVAVFDPPGAQDRTTPGMIAAFIGQIQDTKRYAEQSPYNPKTLGLLEPMPANLFTAKGAFVQNMWNFPNAMTKRDGFIDDLIGALRAVKEGGDVTVIQPEFSQFATPEKMISAMTIATMVAARMRHLRHIQINSHSHPLLAEGTGPNALVTAHKIADETADEK